MVLLTESEISHLINTVKKDNRKLKKKYKEILNDNTEVSELLDILICTLFNSVEDNFKIVQRQKAAIWDHMPIRKRTKRIMNADTSEPHLRNNLVYSDRKDNSQ